MMHSRVVLYLGYIFGSCTVDDALTRSFIFRIYIWNIHLELSIPRMLHHKQAMIHTQRAVRLVNFFLLENS